MALARLVQEFQRVGWLPAHQIEQCPHLEGDNAGLLDPAPASTRRRRCTRRGVDRTCHSIPSLSSRKEPPPTLIAQVTTVARIMAHSRVHSTPSSSRRDKQREQRAVHDDDLARTAPIARPFEQAQRPVANSSSVRSSSCRPPPLRQRTMPRSVR